MGKRKKSLWDNVKNEFNRSPISTAAAFLGICVITYSIISGSLPFAIPTLPNTPHSMTVELIPEFFGSGQIIDYEVEFCNEESSIPSVDEIRIYNNDQYTNFTCNQKPGWETYFIPKLHVCMYVATNWIYYIEPGDCETFEFSAQAPENGCDLTWKFESRDVNSYWMFIYDTTSTEGCFNNTF